MIGKKLTIAEKGGLQTHIEELGGDWNKFLEYWDDTRVQHNTLGRLVGTKEHPFNGRTVKGWREYYKKETNATRSNKHSTPNMD